MCSCSNVRYIDMTIYKLMRMTETRQNVNSSYLRLRKSDRYKLFDS